MSTTIETVGAEREEDRLVRVLEDGQVQVRSEGACATLPLRALPAAYVEWFAEGRGRAYRAILRDEGLVRTFAQHLPAVITWSPGRLFPCNCGNKGVGFLPVADRLGAWIEAFERVQRDTRDQPWRASLEARVRVVSRFYLDREAVDWRLLTGLEIFERRTFANLQRVPLASLLFTGEGPGYLSFQLDCAVETVGPSDARHRFVVLARTMFEYDSFHITQRRFPHAYLFWITGVHDKTPFQVVRELEPLESEAGFRWHPDALAAVQRAPELIQRFVRETVEAFAGRRGLKEITAELVREARDRFVGKP